MPLHDKGPGFIRKFFNSRTYHKFMKTNRVATLLIAAVAVTTAIAFSVSVESRSAGWLWDSRPSAPSSAELVKDSTAPSASASAHQPLGPNAVLLVPTVTATKTDSLFTDVDMDGKADPGDTLKYTVTINASGMDATGVMFTDTVDANTNFVAGTLMTTPLARADSYTATGNVRISISAPGVLANDSDPDGVGPAITATAGSFSSVGGGDVNISADGSFTYNPPAGFEGADSFTYTLNDNEGNTDTGTVSITVSDMIWFVNNNASCPCDGRLTNPFNTLASFQAVNDGVGNHPDTNDNIFVYESGTDYVGPVTLRNGQKFIGQDATASLATIAGITLAPNSDPLPATNSGNGTIVNITSATAGINVGQNNTLRGFTGGNAAPDINGSGFGNLAISDVTLNGTGQALNLTNGTLTPTAMFGSISSSNSLTTGISLTSVAGGLTSGSTTITNPTGIGISVNTSGATLNFANTSATGSGGTGISLTTNTGTITFGSLGITPDAGQRGLLATENTNTITSTSGAIATTTGTAVEITRSSSATPLAMVLTSVSSSGAPNGIMLKNTSGSFTVNGDGANTSVGGNSSGGTMASSAGADGATSGNSVYLENALNVTLRRVTINGTNQNHGIRGVNATNFTLEFSTVTGTNGTNTALDEGSVNFDNLLGSAAITSCVIDGGLEDNLNVVNTSGTLNRLTISGSTFGFNNTINGNNNILLSSNNAGTTMNVTLKSSLIKGARADWISAIANSGSTMDIVIGGPLVADGNNFDNLGANAHAGAAAGGNRVVTTSVGTQTVDIRNNTLKGSKGEAMLVRSTIVGATRGNLDARVRNNTINGNNNILLSSNNAGTTMNVTLKSSLIKGARADWISAIANSASTMDIVIGGPLVADGNNFDNLGANAHAGAAAGGNRVVTTSVGTQTVDIRNNTLKGSKGEAMLVRSTIVGATRGNLNARVRNNTIGVAGTANSGSTEGSGIFLTGDGGGNITAAITNNSVFQYNNHGIRTDFGDEILDGAVYNITVTGNTVSNPGNINTDFNGYHLNNGTVGATDNFTTCLALSGNTLTGSGSGVTPPNNQEFRLRQRQSTTVRLPGYGGANNDNAAVVSFIAGQNTVTAGNGAAANTVPTGGGFVGGAACTAPSFALVTPKSTGGKDHFARVETKPAGSPSSTTNKSTVAVADGGKTKPAPRVLTHHAKISKRAAVETPAMSHNTIANSTVNTPVVNKIASRPSVNVQQDKSKRGGVVVKPGIRANVGGGETVTHSVGTLLAGKTVRIQFQVTVNNPYSGGAFVTNQGTVSGSNFADVLTDDPAVGGANDPTQTPILLTPNLSIADAQANEPTSGSIPMIFTVSLSSPAPASGASVHYETADQAPGAGHAVAGVDYTAIPDTVLNFAAGEQFKTIAVDILFDGNAPEPDETFLVNLSNATNAIIIDNQAVGTIKQGNAAGTFLITELRTSGPGGAGDDFVEVYNNSDMPLTVAASDASAGYGLFKMGANCGASPVLIGTIPNGTIIPARGHYLFTGSAYSLANYGGTGAAAGDQTLSSDIEDDRNVAIFNTASVANLSSVTRLDAAGFGSNTGGVCDLLREGTTLQPLSGSTLQYSYVRDECGKKGNPAMFGVCPTGGGVADTNVNSDDFIFVDTSAANTIAGQRLGAPGPQNLANPLVRNSSILTLLLDSNFGAPAPPNRVRDLTPQANAANGTLSVRRRFVNNTGAPVTRLRFRIVDISTISVPGGIADMRALTSSNVVVNGITDNGTCTAAGFTPPCTITVQGTTLETPPAQAIGGGHNSTMTVVLGTPLGAGASINVQFLLGVQQTGSFKFFFNIEALP